MNKAEVKTISEEVKFNTDLKCKTIKCQMKGCDKEINIPETWDEDYEKNDFFILLSGNEVPNGAFAHPDLGVFACEGCFEKFIAWNWDPPDHEMDPPPNGQGAIKNEMG